MLRFSSFEPHTVQRNDTLHDRTYLEKAHRSAHVAVSYDLPTRAEKAELSSLYYNQRIFFNLSEHEGTSLFLDA